MGDYKGTVTATEDINKRKEDFKKELSPFQKKYTVDMLKRFFDYWTELNRPKTKMKFELQETWDLSGRLATWYKNNQERKFGDDGKPIVVAPANPQTYG